MPLYEYECDACGHRFEIIQKFSDAPVEKCPRCGGAVHKIQSAPAFQFRGSGWYVTDYAKKGDSKSETKSEPKADAKSESTSTSKSDSPAKEAAPAASGDKKT